MAFENIITNDMTCDTLAHHLDIKSLGRLCLCNKQTHSTVLRAMKAAVHPDVPSLPVTPRWTDSEKKYLQQLKSNMSLAPFRKETLSILWNDLSKSYSVTLPAYKKKLIEWLRIIVPLLTIGNMSGLPQNLTLTLDQGPFTLKLEDPTTHDIYGVMVTSLDTLIGKFHENGILTNGRIEFLPKIENQFKKVSEGEFHVNGRLKNGRLEREPKIENKFIKFLEGEFHVNGFLKNGRLEYLPKIENNFQKFQEGEFHVNGALKNGRLELEPKIENDFKKFAEGDFHDNGILKNGRSEFEPKIENHFTKFQEGEFHVNGALKNGRSELEPKIENQFKKFLGGEFHDNGSLKNGRIEVEPNAVNNFRKFSEGEFHANGSFKKGRVEFEPKIENHFTKFQEGEFHVNGTLKNGRLELDPKIENDFKKFSEGEFLDNGSLKDGTIHTTNPAQTIEKKLLADGSYVISIANYSLESLASIEKIVYSPQGTILQQQSPTDHLFSALPIGLKRFLGIV